MPTARLHCPIYWTLPIRTACDRMEAAADTMLDSRVPEAVFAATAEWQQAKKDYGMALLAFDKARDPTRYGLPAHHTRLPGVVRQPAVLSCE